MKDKYYIYIVEAKPFNTARRPIIKKVSARFPEEAERIFNRYHSYLTPNQIYKSREKMDTEENALILAIQQSPHDEEIRAVYADWLEEKGQIIKASLLRAQLLRSKEPRIWDNWLTKMGISLTRH